MNDRMRIFLRLLMAAAILAVAVLAAMHANLLRYGSLQTFEEPVAWSHPDPDGAVRRLSDAVRFRTVSGQAGTGTDSTEFRAFIAFLEQQYPLSFATLEVTRIGGLSLLLKWSGSDPELDPIILMGHYDVVPADPASLDRWTHPPFSGTIADGFIWGRGTLDDKFSVLGTLEAVEGLLAEGHTPRRTIWLSYGHDEEIGGNHGAKAAAAHLASLGVKAHMVVDEGGVVMKDMLPVDRPVALVGIAEKGYLSLRLTVTSSGGHSSMPPRETATGILAAAILNLQENPFPGSVDGVVERMFRHLGPEMGYPARLVFANLWLTRPLVGWALSGSPSTDAMMRTTTAPTMLSGSVKDNVLPAVAEAVVNFRILPGESPESVTARVIDVIDDGRVVVTPYSEEVRIPPSPVSDPDGEAFHLVRRTISQTLDQPYVAPYLVMGATDVRHFAGISDDLFRFMPIQLEPGDTGRIHSVDERVSAEGYVKGIGFYRQLILNAAP